MIYALGECFNLPSNHSVGKLQEKMLNIKKEIYLLPIEKGSSLYVWIHAWQCNLMKFPT